MLQVGTLLELKEVWERMGYEQQMAFEVPVDTLAVVLSFGVIGALVLSCLLLLMQLAREQARMVREAKFSKTRRLRDSTTHEEIDVTPVAGGHFHLFLSHVWGDAQDQMRIIKQRLKEMLPDISCFLDVDDLEEIGDLEGYIARTEKILVYCSKAYFKSKNCMRELVSATKMGKEIIALVDLDAAKGGLSQQQVRERLEEAEIKYYEGWGFDRVTTPSVQALYDHLFAHEPIEWNRLGHFQDVTMRLIAERVLPGSSGKTYVTGELVSQQLQPLPPPTEPKSHHLFCSAYNAGAAALMAEVAKERGMALKMEHIEGEVKTRGSHTLPLQAPLASVHSSHTRVYVCHRSRHYRRPSPRCQR